MAEPVDAYKVLQVDPEAEDEVIKAAYRRLARMYHPDLATGPEASLRMAAINAAWKLIGTPTARAAYDRCTAGDRGRTDPAPGARPASGDRPAARSRRPRPCRATGRPVARRSAAASTRRCAAPRAWARPVRRPDVHRAASSTSGATAAGRSARSPVTTWSTSSGWIERRSGEAIATRSTPSCGRPVAGARRAPRPPSAEGLFRRR